MNNKIVIVGLLLIFLVGCSNFNTFDVNLVDNKDINTIEGLSNEDFMVKYKDIVLSIGEDSQDVFEKIGYGTANEDNNFGFIGCDEENKYKFYGHGYPKENPIIFITTRMSIAEGTSIIYQIDIEEIGTSRGLKKGNTQEDILILYGQPNEKINIDNQKSEWIYLFEKSRLDIVIDEEKKVSNISLSYSEDADLGNESSSTYLDSKSKKKNLKDLEGRWVSTEYNDYQGTEIEIIPKNDIDFDFMKKESIGFLKLDILDKDVVKNLGEPNEKSKANIWGADGLEHQKWIYIKNGIELDMIKSDNNNQIINMITIENPCKYKTSKNIGIGSTKDEVVNAYKSQINEDESENNVIVVGSIYGGIIFTFENNKVSSIFIGAGAE